MNCESCAEWLDEYLAGSLPDETRAEMERHLASCPSCRAELEACRHLAERLTHLPRHAPGAEVCMRVSEGIHAEAPRAHRAEYGPVLDFDDLAEYLQVDKPTLELYVGDIPCFELGGRLLFRKAKVEEWIARREMTVDFKAAWPVAQVWTVSDNAMKGNVSWNLSQKN
jgi:hypothetical protein